MNRIVIAAGSAAAVACLALGAVATTAWAHALSAPSFTAAQAQRGEAVYTASCASCHGDQLDNGEFAPPLAGPVFRQHWGGKGLDEPFAVMTQRMPPDDPGGLDAATYADLLAFLLSKNGVAPSANELPSDPAALKGLAAPN